MIKITDERYTPVECDRPMPCPFCGCDPELAQLAHRISYRRNGKTERVCIIASNQILSADTFWFKCPSCQCTTGGTHDTAQAAALAWNRRQ